MNFHFLAIDPLALILPTNIYLIWVEIHNPHNPFAKDLAEVLEGATAEEKSFISARLANLNAYTAAVNAAMKGHASASVE
jgi:hypothetical protein